MRAKIQATKEKYLPKNPTHRKILKWGSIGIAGIYLIAMI